MPKVKGHTMGCCPGKLFGTQGDIHVSPPPPEGDALGSGTLADPFHSIATAIKAADGGKNVWLAGGRYIEYVNVEHVHGALLNKIVVQPYAGAKVTIDGIETRFFHPTASAQWTPVDSGGPDEYVWTEELPEGEAEEVRRGAFLETPFLSPPRHTRLVTYSQAGDFRATNDLWPQDPPTPDNNVWKFDDATDTWVHVGGRNWVYMGPGLWFDSAERKVHIRLSSTANTIPDWPDYGGPTDPRDVPLALSRETCSTLRLIDCAHIVFKNLTLRFGGQETIRLRDCCHVAFDHVEIRAASRAILLHAEAGEANKRIRFRHCTIDGGLPPWFFRSDRKDTYRFTQHDPDAAVQPQPVGDPPVNDLGRSTTGVLISAGPNAADVGIDHCEIANGHDVYVFGARMRFHHNWVHNINDDALNFGSEDAGTKNAWVYRNVITQSLTALSFAAQPRVGQVRIFHNLVDLREPTLSIRPATYGANPFRTGQLYKQNGPGEGPIDLWHNTCVVLNPGANATADELDDFNAAGFSFYRALSRKPPPSWVTDRRRALNNVFVAVYPNPTAVRPIAFLPPSSFAGPCDGNVYTRVDSGPDVPRYSVTDHGSLPRDYLDLDGATGYTATFPPHEQFGQQPDQPPFLSFALDGFPQSDDDLRPRPDSPAAIAMPADVRLIELRTGGVLALFFGRARGCYRRRADRLRVGVDGARQFPG
jgi:hypothetical protein